MVCKDSLEIRKNTGEIVYWDSTAFRPFPKYVLALNTLYPALIEWVEGKPIKIVVDQIEEYITLNNIRP
jgi:hypothetical protein